MTGARYGRVRFRLAGDRGLLAEYGEGIDPEVNRKVRSVAALLGRDPLPGVSEIVPTYRSLLLVYDPLVTRPERLESELKRLEARLSEIRIPEPRTVTIPVCYGGELGPDLGFVAASHGLTEEEAVRLHTEPTYPIYMIGFTPGFPFLGGLPEALHTPRLETPRTAVPAGSVGIANNQTGIYPVVSPGGWRLIGRTPLRLFDPEKEEPFLYRAGDLIRFRSIPPEEYRRLAGEGAA
ncbi:MAG: 5-oxoprolinase subunit PxpB [Deferrisomatales bacterium]|nr:5-oxoprolinase subunit PxpB [Deferrisomatales bacterium]